MVTRRVQFFRQDQKPGELFSDWARSVQESAAQCQFGAITADDIVVLRLRTGVADKKLALDLYKLKDPNLQQLKDTASAYEVAKRTFAAVATPKESKTFYTTTGQGGPTGNKSKGKTSKGAQAHVCLFVYLTVHVYTSIAERAVHQKHFSPTSYKKNKRIKG